MKNTILFFLLFAFACCAVAQRTEYTRKLMKKNPSMTLTEMTNHDAQYYKDYVKKLRKEHPSWNNTQIEDALAKERKRQLQLFNEYRAAKLKKEFQDDLTKAKRGDRNSIVKVAKYYSSHYNDIGVDNNQVYYWNKKAADRDDEDAIESLARSYELGKYTEKDSAKALPYLKRLGEKGNEYAMKRLAQIYHDGTSGESKNWKEAAKWYRRLLERKPNNAWALYNLGKLLRYGKHSLPKNEKESLDLFEQAARCDTSWSEPCLALGDMYYNGGQTFVRNLNRCKNWYKKVANKKSKTKDRSVARLKLMDLYYDDYKSNKQKTYLLDSALFWSQKVEEDNKYYNSYNLIEKRCREIQYQHSEQKNKLQDQAIYDQICADIRSGKNDKLMDLAELYRKGNRVVPKNQAKAIETYKKASDKGLIFADIELAHIYNVGEDVPPNRKLARKHAKKVHKHFNNFNYWRTYKYYSEINDLVGWPCNFLNLPGGIYAGYLQQTFLNNVDGIYFRGNEFGCEDVWSRGFMLGLHFNPSLEWGLGFRFGLFFEQLYGRNDDAAPLTYDRSRFSSFYVPLDLTLRIPFSKSDALILRGGLGSSLITRGRMIYSLDSDVPSQKIEFGGDGQMQRFNPSLEMGFELRLGHISFEGMYGRGIRKIEYNVGSTAQYETLLFGVTVLPE